MYEASYHGEVSYRDPEAAREFVVKIAVLCAYDTSSNSFTPIDDLPIGLFEDAYTIITENSGYGELDSLVENINFFRSVSTQPHVQAMAFICKAFNGYTPRDIENMSVAELAKNIVLAEQIHEVPFQIVTEEQMQQESSQEEAGVMNSIKREARQNDRIMGGARPRMIDFGGENADLNEAMN